MRPFAFTVVVVTLLPLAALLAEPPPPHATKAGADGFMVKRSEIIKKKPVADLGVARYWAVERDEDVWSLLVEVTGTIPLHFHPDGVHRMYILEGKLRCTVGNSTMDMEPGDYMLIPRGTQHKFEKLSAGKAYFVTVDTPPINPANNVWLEAAPKK